MIETPEQPSYAAELALVGGFILLLVFEAAFAPADGWRTLRLVAGSPAASAAQEAPPRPVPAPSR